MASDDNESNRARGSSENPAPEKPEKPLPASVERALAEARASAAGAGNKSALPGTKGARWLALVPVTIAALGMLLMMPRSAPPEEVPLPHIDGAALQAQRQDDIARAASARATRLGGDILLVGTTLRALNVAQVTGAPAEDVGSARTAVENAFRAAAAVGPAGIDGLKTLRAVQVETFLTEVERFESTGATSAELEELAGPFLDHVFGAGWIQNGKVLLDGDARRAAYKVVWNAQLGADRLQGMELGIDEQRALYTFYLTHPHASELQRATYEAMRKRASSPRECAKANAEEHLDMEQWRIEKIRRLGEIDPTYPTAYALGVAFYRSGRLEQSIESFERWIANHPDGPYALRARNHLKAAVTAFGPS